jgi:carboxylesterase
MMSPNILFPKGEPFLLQGSRSGCLLIHGFTGAPDEMLPLGKHLSSLHHHTVLGIRLAGHATRMKDLNRTRWEDWAASVEDGLHLLRGMADQVFLLGHSMGGVLALYAAANYQVDGVIAMSTPYQLRKDWRLPIAEYLSPFIPSIAKGSPEWEQQHAANQEPSYLRYPTRAIAEMRDLLAAMRNALPDITAPTLMMHSKEDRSAPFENLEQISSHLGNQRKESLAIEKGGHMIVLNEASALVFQSAAHFIEKLVRQPDKS